MNFKYLLAAAMATGLSSCVTNYKYEPIIPNPPNMEMTQARCQMMAGSVDQGYIAFGSTSYVTGAAIGNALGNAIREDQFMQQCMTMNGWRRVAGPGQTSSTKHSSGPKWTPPKQRPAVLGGKFPPAPK
ncbi:hypothetical protein RsS62_64530 [Rhizobium dioscoreae]|uniref:hypothetical protein n=1 Tax=Rhizobium TaxID=379 RepID=UPI000BA8975D|nr:MULTISPECIES: hypothetical protein [Rhizobium]ASW08569.1 hypothetical protein CKA34_21475 [Rhizobium sp. 11515TR]GES47201.1 hypothetical protein RsS62_64530 [Rhizobium dioscoreae]